MNISSHLNAANIIISSHLPAPGNSKQSLVLLCQPYLQLLPRLIDSYVCLCLCVPLTLLQNIVDSAVIARSAMLLWLCSDL